MFGTEGSGLDITKTFIHFTKKDGLPSDNRHDILLDYDGEVWISTGKVMGMDIIKTKIKKLNDRIKIDTQKDKS